MGVLWTLGFVGSIRCPTPGGAVIGANGAPPLPMSGSLPPDLQGTLFRVGPAWPWGCRAWRRCWGSGGGRVADGGRWDGRRCEGGALHAVELRDGKAVWYLRQESEADAGVFWHAGSVLALPEAGIPSQYSRFLEPEEFAGGLTVPIASHVHRLAADGGRVLFGVDDGSDGDGGDGATTARASSCASANGTPPARCASAQSVELERATWQHDIGVTAEHVVFIESPTTRLAAGHGGASAVPFGWVPGAEGWIGVVRRDGGGATGRIGGGAMDPARSLPGDPRARGVRRTRRGHRPLRLLLRRARGRATRRPLGVGRRPRRRRADGDRRDPRRAGALADRRASGSSGCRSTNGSSSIHGWTPCARARPFRYGYSLETAWAAVPSASGVPAAEPDGPRLERRGVAGRPAEIRPGPGRGRVLEPRARAHAERAPLRAGRRRPRRRRGLAADRRRRRQPRRQRPLRPRRLRPGPARPEAVIHLPARLPVRSHGEWVPADRYR